MEKVSKKHHGHAIQRMRKCHNWSRATLGEKVCMEQQAIYRIEQKEVIEDGILTKFAKALNVSIDLLKNMDDQQQITNYFVDNSFFSTESSMINASSMENNSTSINPSNKEENFMQELKKVYQENILIYKEFISAKILEIDKLHKNIVDLTEEIKQLRNMYRNK